MTNKEAIEWLISMYNIANQINDCLEYKETLDIAIKALEQQQNIHDTCKKCVEFSEFEQQPCEDCISREAVKDMLTEEWTKYVPMELDVNISFVLEKINELPSVTPKARWIPIKTRPMTEEEKEHFSEYADSRFDDTYTMLDCPLPDDGQEVILSVNGYVSTDIFCRDSADGCYFESYDIDDVEAWMPLPEPYKGDEKCL